MYAITLSISILEWMDTLIGNNAGFENLLKLH
jgi:hypothetical protein